MNGVVLNTDSEADGAAFGQSEVGDRNVRVNEGFIDENALRVYGNRFQNSELSGRDRPEIGRIPASSAAEVPGRRESSDFRVVYRNGYIARSVVVIIDGFGADFERERNLRNFARLGRLREVVTDKAGIEPYTFGVYPIGEEESGRIVVCADSAVLARHSARRFYMTVRVQPDGHFDDIFFRERFDRSRRVQRNGIAHYHLRAVFRMSLRSGLIVDEDKLSFVEFVDMPRN